MNSARIRNKRTSGISGAGVGLTVGGALRVGDVEGDGAGVDEVKGDDIGVGEVEGEGVGAATSEKVCTTSATKFTAKFKDSPLRFLNAASLQS
jgi:hypothetical protein